MNAIGLHKASFPSCVDYLSKVLLRLHRKAAAPLHFNALALCAQRISPERHLDTALSVIGLVTGMTQLSVVLDVAGVGLGVFQKGVFGLALSGALFANTRAWKMHVDPLVKGARTSLGTPPARMLLSGQA
jgi:hypothetical protein